MWMPSSTPLPQVNLNDNAFPAFLESNITCGAEVPTCIIPHCDALLRKGYTKVGYTLSSGSDYEGRRVTHHKTVSTILQRFLYAENHTMRIAHIITSKNVHYFGCRGIILDSHYNPLLISTAELNLDSSRRILLTNPKCKISYRIFDNPSELLEKTIIKQGIPFLSHNGVNVQYGSDYKITYVDIEIGDFDYMVRRPSKPTISQMSSGSISKTILENYGD